ncbi:hypothetical protein JCM5176_05600 [Streptococcus sobrinus]
MTDLPELEQATRVTDMSTSKATVINFLIDIDFSILKGLSKEDAENQVACLISQLGRVLASLPNFYTILAYKNTFVKVDKVTETRKSA